MQKDGCAISRSSNTWQNSFCKDIVTRHVRVHKSKWFIQISARCYYSGKYSLQGFVTASNVYICQHSNCYCQKDTKIFYKLSNNKSARLIWVYFLLHRRENLPGLILESPLGQNFPRIWLFWVSTSFSPIERAELGLERGGKVIVEGTWIEGSWSSVESLVSPGLGWREREPHRAFGVPAAPSCCDSSCQERLSYVLLSA